MNMTESVLKKSAFTLAEVLVALTIIGVVMSLVIPVVVNTVTDTSGLQYKKVITDIQNAIDMAKEDPDSYVAPLNYSPVNHFIDVTPANFCTMVTNQYTTVGEINCNIDSSDTTKTPNFQQLNGVSYWNIGGEATETATFYDKDTGTACSSSTPISSRNRCIRTIWIDINGSNKGKNIHGKDRFRLQIRYDGKVMLGRGGDWDTVEQQTIQDSTF